MASRQIIQTPDAPAAIGTYSQAVRVHDTVYLNDAGELETLTDCPYDLVIELKYRGSDPPRIPEPARGRNRRRRQPGRHNQAQHFSHRPVAFRQGQ